MKTISINNFVKISTQAHKLTHAQKVQSSDQALTLPMDVVMAQKLNTGIFIFKEDLILIVTMYTIN